MTGLGAPEARKTLEVPNEGEAGPWTSHESSPSPYFLTCKIGRMDWMVKIK